MNQIIRVLGDDVVKTEKFIFTSRKKIIEGHNLF